VKKNSVSSLSGSVRVKAHQYSSQLEVCYPNGVRVLVHGEINCNFLGNHIQKYADQSPIIFSWYCRVIVAITITEANPKGSVETFRNFVEIFRSLSDNPSKTLQGLWAELFLIEKSKSPDTLLNYWHNLPEERFDFNADPEKLEVKSSSNMERVHIFTSEQLNPPVDKQVIIASVFTKQSSSGQNISDLLESIQNKLFDISLMDKLFTIVAKTLGNTVEQSFRIKYDYILANNSLRFYSHQDISKIERLSIPDRVSEVKYKSDLTDISPIDPNTMESDGELFRAI